MLKKLLAIAMIGTAMTAPAEVPMEFRDGCMAVPDFGGHFFHAYDEATGVTTFKSINSATTYQQVVDFCNEAYNGSNKNYLQEPTKSTYEGIGGPLDENGFWTKNVADMTGGVRYFRTKKTVDKASWESKGLTTAHKYLAFDYKTNKAHEGGQIAFQEPQMAIPANFALTVSADWQTCVTEVAIPEDWRTDNGGKYMWIMFDQWANSKDEIIVEVKNLRFLTGEDLGLDPEPVIPGTEPGEVSLPLEFSFTHAGAWEKLEENMDPFGGIPYTLKTGDGNALFSQHFVGTIPASATILEFDYQVSEAIKAFTIYVVPTRRDHNPAPESPLYSALGIVPIVQMDLEEWPFEKYDQLGDPEATWNHVKIDLAKDKMSGVHAGDFTKVQFAQRPNSNEYLHLQAQIYQPDTQVYFRNFTLSADPSGIQGVGAEEDSEVVSSQYFDLQGRQLKAAPESGLYLRRDLRANGTSTTIKAVK